MTPIEHLQHVNCQSLGFPIIPKTCLMPKVTGNVIAWVPYMSTKVADWFLIQRRKSWIDRYLKDGGDPGKAIIHHLCFDEGTIDSLWGKAYFRKWVDILREFGIKYVCGVDFSMYGDMPVALQIHNAYRSAVVNMDYADYGFKLLPNIVTGSPILSHISSGFWPHECETVLSDCQHFATNKDNEESRWFWRRIDYLCNNFKFQNMLVYARTKTVIREVQKRGALNTVWVPSQMFVRDQLIKAIKKKREEKERPKNPKKRGRVEVASAAP